MDLSDRVVLHFQKWWVLVHLVFGLLVLLLTASLAVWVVGWIAESETGSSDPVFGAFYLAPFVLFGSVVLLGFTVITRVLFSTGPALILDPLGIRIPIYSEELIPWSSVWSFEAGLHASSNRFPWYLFRYPVRIHTADRAVVDRCCGSVPAAVRWIAYGHAWVVMKLRGYYTFELSGYWIKEKVEDSVDDMERIASAADPRFRLNDE